MSTEQNRTEQSINRKKTGSKKIKKIILSLIMTLLPTTMIDNTIATNDIYTENTETSIDKHKYVSREEYEKLIKQREIYIQLMSQTIQMMKQEKQRLQEEKENLQQDIVYTEGIQSIGKEIIMNRENIDPIMNDSIQRIAIVAVDTSDNLKGLFLSDIPSIIEGLEREGITKENIFIEKNGLDLYDRLSSLQSVMGPEDQLNFIYTGHGHDDEGHSYILGSYADSLFRDQTRNIKGSIYCVVDACRSGGFVSQSDSLDNILIVSSSDLYEDSYGSLGEKDSSFVSRIAGQSGFTQMNKIGLKLLLEEIKKEENRFNDASTPNSHPQIGGGLAKKLLQENKPAND